MRGLLFWAFPALLAAASVDYQKSFGGNGNSSVTAVVTDKAGNTYLAGTTFALDFPVKNAYQPRNSGTAVVVSDDLGRTWSPLGLTPPFLFTGPTIDPSNSAILIASGVYGIYRSSDSGKSWRTVTNFNGTPWIDHIEFDPMNPTLVYASANGGVLKSTDTGLTWKLLTQGLTPGLCCIGGDLSVDPFQSGHILYSNSSGGFVSTDAGATWKPLSLPLTQPPNYQSYTVRRVLFDPHTRDIWYSYNYFGVYESLDSGATWRQLPINVQYVNWLYVDPILARRLFAFASDGLWRSLDGGNSWTKLMTVSGWVSYAIAVLPTNPNVVVIGGSEESLISSDGGQSWQPMDPSRSYGNFAFDPARLNRLYATSGPTSDVFVVKLNPSGEVVYSTYLGGHGSDSASSLAVDDAGNVYLTGTDGSTDFPNVTARLNSSTLPTSFAAKLDSMGKPVYVTLFDRGSIAASTIDAEGHFYLVGTTSTTTGVNNLFAARLTPDGTAFEYSVHFTGATIGMAAAVDYAGNLVVTGTFTDVYPYNNLLKLDPTGRPVFEVRLPVDPVKVLTDAGGNIYVAGTASLTAPVTPGAFQSTIDTSCSNNSGGLFYRPSEKPPYMTDVWVAKLSPDASSLIFATLLGGACRDEVTGLALGSDDSVYVAGNTYSNPFPTVDALTSGPPPPETAKGFLAHFDAAGSRLLFSSYLDFGSGPRIAIDLAGDAYATWNPPRNYDSNTNPWQVPLWKVTPVRMTERKGKRPPR